MYEPSKDEWYKSLNEQKATANAAWVSVLRQILDSCPSHERKETKRTVLGALDTIKDEVASLQATVGQKQALQILLPFLESRFLKTPGENKTIKITSHEETG